jgi:hypothetical protein
MSEIKINETKNNELYNLSEVKQEPTVTPKKKAGRKPKLPNDPEERKKYIRDHYSPLVKRYKKKISIEQHQEPMKRLYEIIHNASQFSAVEELMNNIHLSKQLLKTINEFKN